MDRDYTKEQGSLTERRKEVKERSSFSNNSPNRREGEGFLKKSFFFI